MKYRGWDIGTWEGNQTTFGSCMVQILLQHFEEGCGVPLGHGRKARSRVKRIPLKVEGDRLRSLDEVGEVASAPDAQLQDISSSAVMIGSSGFGW